MSPTWLRPRWLFNRRVAKTLLWTMLLLAAVCAPAVPAMAALYASCARPVSSIIAATAWPLCA